MPMRPMRLLPAAALLAALPLAALAQSPRPAPDARNVPEVQRDQAPGDFAGSSVTPPATEGVPRGVVRPPTGMDPGIQDRTRVPDPNPSPGLVVPPPGTPQNAPHLNPR